MAQLTLIATPRTILGKKVKRLRQSGQVPANLYGHNVPSQAIQVPTKELQRITRQAGTSALVELRLEGEQRMVMLRQIKHNAISGAPLHVDFYQVNMTEPIIAEVPLHFNGEAPAVRSVGATVLTLLTHVRVRALPAQVPASIHLDLAPLVNIDDALHVRDLHLPDGVEVLAEPDEMVLKVNAPRKAAEEAAPEAAEAPATPETTAATGESGS